jgi:hypothetical protein
MTYSHDLVQLQYVGRAVGDGGSASGGAAGGAASGAGIRRSAPTRQGSTYEGFGDDDLGENEETGV